MADTVKIERTCTSCGAVHVLTVSATGFAAWDMGRGAFIQDAFPELTSGERELLKTGMCGACFDALFDGLPDEPPPSWLIARADQQRAERDERRIKARSPRRVGDTGATPGTGQDANPVGPGVTPGRSAGVGATPQECVQRALLGLTAEGEPATRGHLRAPVADWPRCTTELPSLYSPVFEADPKICNRPATLLMAFTHDYVRSMAEHRCGDPNCPIGDAGMDPQIVAQMQRHHVPLCAMHLPWLRETEANWVRDVGAGIGVWRTFDLAVIGVESVSLLGGGHPDGAQIIDLRPITEPIDGPGA